MSAIVFWPHKHSGKKLTRFTSCVFNYPDAKEFNDLISFSEPEKVTGLSVNRLGCTGCPALNSI